MDYNCEIICRVINEEKHTTLCLILKHSYFLFSLSSRIIYKYTLYSSFSIPHSSSGDTFTKTNCVFIEISNFLGKQHRVRASDPTSRLKC